MSTVDSIPACVCTAHPSGDDKVKYMRVVECSNETVVFCCQRCTEITHTPVIQVRTLKYARDRAKYVVEQQRKQLPPQLLRMLHQRRRGRIRYRKEDQDA